MNEALRKEKLLKLFVLAVRTANRIPADHDDKLLKEMMDALTKGIKEITLDMFYQPIWKNVLQFGSDVEYVMKHITKEETPKHN